MVVRIVLWLAFLAIVLGLSGLAWLIVESFRSTPGANMVLIGLPIFALPVLFGAMAAHLTVEFRGA